MTEMQLPANADYFQINDIDLHPELTSLKLGMINPVEIIQYEISLEGLLFLRLSKTTGDEDGIYQIGEIRVIRSIEPKSTLRNLGYGFVNPSIQQCYHLQIDGEFVLDATSTSFNITQTSEQHSSFRPRIYPPRKS